MKKLVFPCLYFFCWAVIAQDIDYFDKIERFVYRDLDSAKFYLEKSYQKSLKDKDWPTALETLTYSNLASGYHNDIDLFAQSIKRQDSLFKIVDLSSLEEDLYYRISYSYDHGLYYYKLQDYGQSLDHFFKMVNYFDEDGDIEAFRTYSPYITAAYARIANIYQNERKFNIAEEFYNEAMRIVSLYEADHEQQLDYKNLIASVKAVQMDFQESNELAKSSVAYYLANDPTKNLNALITTSRLIVSNYIKLNKPDSAAFYIERMKPFLEKRERYKNSYNRKEAELALIKGDTMRAIHIYENIVETIENRPQNHAELASALNEIGNVYYNLKQYDSASIAFKRGLSLFSDLEPSKKPLQTLELFDSYATLLNKQNSKTDLKKVLALVEEALEIIEGAKQSFYDDSDKLLFTENTLPILENGIEACQGLYADSKKRNYIEIAFRYFEKSKSPVLLEALQTNIANKFSGIPDDLLEKERLIKIKISDLQKSYVVQNDTLSEKELFNLRREHEDLIAEMEEQHPNYFNLKYQEGTIELNELQNKIENDDQIISFFFGTNAIYRIVIGKSHLSFSKIQDVEDLSRRINAVQTKLASNSGFDNAFKNDLFVLYETFISKSIQIKKGTNLTVIPDGPLRSIPFEALITDVDKLTFLIENVNINYQNSATVASHLMSKKNHNLRLLAMAPTFNGTIKEFQQLPNAEKEIETILGYFEGKQLKGKAATISNFKLYSKDYPIIHLATHTKLNDQFPEYSYMAFTSDQDEKVEYLYQNDIYNMNLDAEMVTLSACETGVGELKKGEGLMSLSRAFFYSGAKSLVTSLWKIDDKASYEIMDGFYKNLSENQTKPEAARNAKLAFIEKNRDNPLIHPYYWSGLIVYGDASPLKPKANYIWIILLAVILISGTVFLKFRKSV